MTPQDPKITESGWTVQVNGSTAVFKRGDITARVLVKDGELQFAHASSAAQRLFLASVQG